MSVLNFFASMRVFVTLPVFLKTEVGGHSAASDPNQSETVASAALCFSLVFVCMCVPYVIHKRVYEVTCVSVCA